MLLLGTEGDVAWVNLLCDGASCWGDGLEEQVVSASMGTWKEFAPEHQGSVTMQHFT